MNKSFVVIGAVLLLGLAGGFGIASFVSPDHEKVADNGGKKILYWVAPMDASFRKDAPGKSPMGMDLVPVYEGAQSGASSGEPALHINPAITDNLGVRSAPAKRGAFHREIETVGYIVPNDNRQSEVTVRTEGWIENLAIKTPGERVEKGDLLFRMYAPELANTQAEYLQAARLGNASLRDAARARLNALGMTAGQIDAMAKKGAAEPFTDVRAPQAGTLLDLNVTEGAYVKPGVVIARLADLSSIWVMAEIFENQVPWLQDRADATMRLAFAPGQSWTGRVDYVYPTVDPDSRTVKLRLVFDNPDNILKPNMYANLRINGETRQDVVTIPREALIRTGTSDRVILSLGEGRFRPAEVVAGVESGDRIEISRGLEAGETVVTSSQFLIDSEASLDASLLRLVADDGASEMKMDMPTTNSPDPAATEAIAGHGRVTAVQANTVTLAHDPIPAIGWPSMTMGFATKSGLLKGLAVGDEVDFNLMKMPDGTYMITDIRKATGTDQ